MPAHVAVRVRFTLGMAVVIAMITFVFFASSGDALAQSPDAAGARAAAAVEEGSFAKVFFISEGSVFGTMLIWFLMFLSAASIGLIGYMWLNNRRVNILPDGVVEEVRRLVEAKQYRQLIALTEQESSYFSRVMTAAFHEASHGFTAMIRALEQAGEEYTTRRFRRIEILSVIGNVAPMLGLFGTVYGMILAFQGIVAAGGRPDPVDLAGGIGTALVTTFWGLIVAIPSLAAYAVIRNNIDALTSEATLVAEEIVNQFRPAAVTTAPPSPQMAASQRPPASSASATSPGGAVAAAGRPVNQPMAARPPRGGAGGIAGGVQGRGERGGAGGAGGGAGGGGSLPS